MMIDDSQNKLILIDNMHKVVERGEQNLFRYHFACMSLDKEGKGWVYLDFAIPIIAEYFNVQEKTVRRKLWENVNKGYATIHDNRYFYNQAPVRDFSPSAVDSHGTGQRDVFLNIPEEFFCIAGGKQGSPLN